MAKKTYYVDSERTLNHDGVMVEGGQKIEMDDKDEATQSLLAAGIIHATKPVEEVFADAAELEQRVIVLEAANADLANQLVAATKKLEAATKPK